MIDMLCDIKQPIHAGKPSSVAELKQFPIITNIWLHFFLPVVAQPVC